jgi:hypothetical protein
MTVVLEQRAPTVRCYECGSAEVRALCHHCWRPGCAHHVLAPPDWAQRLFGYEGNGPGLKQVPPYHCNECAHIQFGHWLEVGVAGVGLALIGVFAVLVTRLPGLVLLVVGASAAAWAYVRIRRRSVQVRAGLPVPLHPKVADVRLIERLGVRIVLEPQGVYTVQADPVEGELTAILTFGRHDRDRVNRHALKRRLGPDHAVPYAAGSLVPQGRLGISDLSDIPVLPIAGDARDILAFRSADAPTSSRRPFRQKYRLVSDPDLGVASVWITPSIVPDSERHVLELDIQWAELGPDRNKPLSLDVIDLLRVNCPIAWGSVHGSNHPVVRVLMPGRAEADQEVRTLEWEQLSLTELERRERHLTMLIQFEHHIAAEDNLSGHLEVTLDGSLSGVDGIRMYNSLGAYRRVSGAVSVKTRVEADFKLSLASIRYQAVRVYPDRADEDSDRDGHAHQYQVVPDYETVIALTNALAGAGYYVKRVLENPPRSGGRGDVVQRYWDIAGRHYQGVYPIDFHLVLTGEEKHAGDVRPESGSMKVTIVVHGPYTDKCMSEGVKEEWTRLHEVIDDALTSRAPRRSGPAPGR